MNEAAGLTPDVSPRAARSIWVSLLGLFTGYRLDELGRLAVADASRQPEARCRRVLSSLEDEGVADEAVEADVGIEGEAG